MGFSRNPEDWEYGEYPPEDQEELGAEFDQEGIDESLIEPIPDVYWAEDIAGIENPELRTRAIEQAESIRDARAELETKLDAGVIDLDQFEAEVNFNIRPKESRASSSAGLNAAGITYDDLGSLSEDRRFLEEKAADPDSPLVDLKAEVRKKAHRMGPDHAQELADRMYEEEELTDEAYELISCENRRVKIERSDFE